MSAFLTYNVCPEDYGAVGDGVTDDTAALQAAINYLASLPQGGNVWLHQAYAINAGGLQAASNVMMRGTGKLVLTAMPTAGIIHGSSLSRFRVHEIQIDAGNFYPPINIGAIHIIDSVDCSIESVNLFNMGKFGIAIKGGNYNRVQDNVVQLTTASPQQNQSVLLTLGAATPENSYIRGNIFVNTGIDVLTGNTIISDNIMFNYKFGGAIATELNPNSKNLVIANNILYGGAGTDVNNTNCEGIENWAAYSVVANNVVYKNAGDGISQGGMFSSTTGNVCYNNGIIGGSGITARYGNSLNNASSGCFAGNTSIDANAGSGTQTYGYTEESASLVNIQVTGNQVSQNKSGMLNIKSPSTTFDSPALIASYPYAGITVAPGAQGGFSFPIVGASFGDLVSWGYSASTGGLLVTVYINAGNSVRVEWYNATSTSITLPAGSWSVKVEKNPAATVL